jgi:hypothetical protein
VASAGDPLQLLERDFQAEIRAPALAAITGLRHAGAHPRTSVFIPLWVVVA